VWQITPNRRASLLFVKPLPGAHRTNMTVVTDKRTYLFDLVPAIRRGTVPMTPSALTMARLRRRLPNRTRPRPKAPFPSRKP
jgi:hypothetical protein